MSGAHPLIADRGMTELEARTLGRSVEAPDLHSIQSFFKPDLVGHPQAKANTAFATLAWNAYEWVETHDDAGTAHHACQYCGAEREKGHLPVCLIAIGLDAAKGRF
jgi:hypothetical protein